MQLDTLKALVIQSASSFPHRGRGRGVHLVIMSCACSCISVRTNGQLAPELYRLHLRAGNVKYESAVSSIAIKNVKLAVNFFCKSKYQVKVYIFIKFRMYIRSD